MSLPPSLPPLPSLSSSPAAADRVAVIEHSLRAYTFGLFSILPLLGLPFAIKALIHARRAKKLERATWNAAQGYRRSAVALGSLGLLLGLILLAGLLGALLESL